MAKRAYAPTPPHPSVTILEPTPPLTHRPRPARPSSNSPTPSHRSKLSRTSRSPSRGHEGPSSPETESGPDEPAPDVPVLPPHSETHRCTACRALLPNTWLLDLHISERHDVLIAKRREDGEKTYRCFIPTCEKVTGDTVKRRRHLIDKHLYPKNFDFGVVQRGVRDGSLLRKPRMGRGDAGAGARGGSRGGASGDGRAGRPGSRGNGRGRGASRSDADGADGGGGGANPRGGRGAAHRGQPRGQPTFARPPVPHMGLVARGPERAPKAAAAERDNDDDDSDEMASGSDSDEGGDERAGRGDKADEPDAAMEGIMGSMAALKFVPASLRLGKGRPRQGRGEQG